MEIPAADYFNAICFYEICICAHVLYICGSSRISTSEGNRVVIEHRPAQIIVCAAHCFYFSELPEVIGKWIDLAPGVLGIKIKNQFLFFVEAQVFVLNVIQLTIDNNDACNKNDREHELEYHQ